MKKITFISFVLLLLLFNCHDTRDASTENQVSPFNKNVGKKISMEQALRWIDRYKQNTNSSRSETTPQLSEETLTEILNPISEKLGASFHRAIDQTGGYHILVVPVRQGQPTWDAEKILDANSGTLIDSQTAENWASRYKTQNPNGVWSHFFGIHVFDESFHTIDLVDALNDHDVLQLLLFIWRDEPNPNGRTNSTEPDIFDHGQICPPHCGVSGDSNN